MLFLLESTGTVSDFVFNFVTYARYVVICVALLCALTIIISVLCQNQSSGANSITGGYSQDSYYSKHRGSTIEEKLSKVTMWSSIILAVCVVLYYVSFLIITTAGV